MDFDGEPTQRQKDFLRDINKEAEQEIVAEELYGFANDLIIVEEGDFGWLKKVENDKKQLERIQRICYSMNPRRKSKPTKHTGNEKDHLRETVEIAEEVIQLVNPMIRELTRIKEDFEKLKRDHQRSSDLRAQRSQMLAQVAGKIKEFLKKKGVKDPNFWTAGVIFWFGGFALEYAQLDEAIQDRIKQASTLSNLNRKEGGEGWRLKDYIRRLLKRYL